MKSVLYINYIDMNDRSSGSGVRPCKMFEAMKSEGLDVKLLTGEQGRGYEKSRKKSVAEIKRWLRTNTPDFCYVESPTYPVMCRCDRALFKLLKKKNIPTGYFYRDFYRKFPELFPRRSGVVNSLKELYLDVLQKLTDRSLKKYADIVYVPSCESIPVLEKYGFENVIPLPPAGDDKLREEKKPMKSCIYVGGITEHYGGELLLDAFGRLNSGEDEYKLILVCRKEEWKKLEHPLKTADWIELYHASGQELERLYDLASVALLVPKSKNEYNDLAVSVKLFEYMSHGLPMVSSKSAAMDRFINGFGLGISTEYDADEFADAIRKITAGEEYYLSICKNVKEALLQDNLWVHRVRQVEKELCGSARSK